MGIYFKTVFIYPADLVTMDPDDWCNKIMIGLDYAEIERVDRKYQLLKEDQKWMFIGNKWVFSKFNLSNVKRAFKREGYALIDSEVFPCPLQQRVGNWDRQRRDLIVSCSNSVPCGSNGVLDSTNVWWTN